jgi:hypothetical protein
MLSNIKPFPAQGQFLDDSERSVKRKIVEDYNTHMGYVAMSYKMANSYSTRHCTWKWTKKLFSFASFGCSQCLHSSTVMWGQTYPQEVRKRLMRETWSLQLMTHTCNWSRPNSMTSQLSRFEVKHVKHWPVKGNKRRCRVCSHRGKEEKTVYCCKSCDVGLCIN